MDNKKKLALLITTTMLVASPLYGCGKKYPNINQNKLIDEEEEEQNSSTSNHSHIYPGFFRNRNSSFKNGSSGGSSGKSWGVPSNNGSYSHGHGGSVGS